MSDENTTVNIDVTVMDDIKVRLDDLTTKVDSVLVEIQQLRDSIQAATTTE